MRPRYSGLSIRLFLMCVILVFGTVIAAFQFSYRLVEREVRANNGFFIQHLQTQIDQYISLTYASLETMLYSVEAAYLSNGSDSAEMRGFLNKLFEVNIDLIKDVYVINPDTTIVGGSVVSAGYDGAAEWREPILRSVSANKGIIYFSAPYFSKLNGWTVTMAKAIAGTEPMKVAAIDIDLTALEHVLVSMNRSDSIITCIVAANGMLVSGDSGGFGSTFELDENSRLFRIGDRTSEELVGLSEQTALLETGLSGPDNRWTMTKLPGSRFHWSVLTFTNELFLQQSLERFHYARMQFLAAGLLGSILIAALITRYIRNPLQSLMKKMRMIKKGYLDTPVVLDRRDEFGELSQSFDLMLGRIRELIRDVEQEKELKRILEIQVLQSQINPHFLYNTLGAISNVVSLGQADQVDAIIDALIRILEYGIADVSESVPLREELDNVEHYLFIQNTRYNASFKLETEIEDGLLDFPIFRMMLQPLVENSLFHGYKAGRIPGTVTIRAFRRGDRMLLEVQDEGTGMTKERLGSVLMLAYPAQAASGRRRRIGLLNIHQRIRLYCGPAYGLEIYSETGSGTCVRASFPWHRKEKQAT